jgi:hypothetical protein
MGRGLTPFVGSRVGAPASTVKRAALLPAVGLLIATACGGHQPTGDGGSPHPFVNPTGSASSSTDQTDGTTVVTTGGEESSRPDVLSLPTTAFTLQLCGSSLDPTPLPTPHIILPDPVEMLQSFRICFFGFDPTQEIDASIQASDGTVVASDQVPIFQLSGVGTWRLFVYPEDPIVPNVTYTVNGSQGAVAAAPVPLVVTSPERRIAMKPPSSGPPGTTFSLALAGFEPGESVPLYLYSCTGAGAIQTCTFLRDLPQAQMDENGQGLFSIETLADDPAGGYAVGFGTTAAARFVLT